VSVYTLILFPTFSKRVCLHSRNGNDKYCVVITPVDQRLQSVEYAWWQKQHTMFTLC